MNWDKSNTYTQTKKILCDWTDKKNYLIPFRMLKCYVREGMVVEKVLETISFKQSKWLEKYNNSNTQKTNLETNVFEKDFYKLLNKAFYGKTMKNVRSPIKKEYNKRWYWKIIKQQSKLTFKRIHKSYTNYYNYTFKQSEVLMDKTIYLGFAILNLTKLLMYATYYDKLQPHFVRENLQLHYMNTDSFGLSDNTKNIIKDLKNLDDLFEFSNLNENHELIGNKKKKVIGKFRIETHKNNWIDEFVCLRCKMFSFKCGDDSKNKIKRVFLKSIEKY